MNKTSTTENTDSPLRPVDTDKPATERRAATRYYVRATAEFTEAKSGVRIEARISSLSRHGCYADTNNPFPPGTLVKVRITKETESFEAQARVVYTQSDKGMGLFFASIEPEPLRILEKFLVGCVETAWLSSARRKSQRVIASSKVRVSGNDAKGSAFEEDAYTRSISAHGALIPMEAVVEKGQTLILLNVRSNSRVECVVAHIGKPEGKYTPVGVQFVLPNPKFWGVAFPPSDWWRGHPDAKP